MAQRFNREARRRARGPGRPRSRRADEAIREAALELLAELGYTGLSMDSLAEHARVSKATIYRRWPSKEEMVASLLDEFVGEVAVPDTGSTREEIRAAVERVAHFYRWSAAGRVIAALVSEMASHPRVAGVVRSRFESPWRLVLRSVLKRGIERGDLRSDVDLDVASDLLTGPIVYRTLLAGGAMGRAYVQALADEVYRALAVASGAAGRLR